MHIYIRIYIYIYIDREHIWSSRSSSLMHAAIPLEGIHMYTCTCMYMYTYIPYSCIDIYTQIYIHIHMYICIHMYIYVRTYIYIYIDREHTCSSRSSSRMHAAITLQGTYICTHIHVHLHRQSTPGASGPLLSCMQQYL